MNKQQITLKGGKKIKQVKSLLDSKAKFTLDEAIDFIKNNNFTKFDSTLEVVFNLGVDTKHSDQQVRGVVSMPHGTGKIVRVAVFAKDAKLEEAKNAGADIYGADELVQLIQSGEVNFDYCIATPDMMGVVGKVAKILGPKGLMPNPKLGTVTADVAGAIAKIKAGQVEYRAEKAGIVHAGVGKVSFEKLSLAENTLALYHAVLKAKPASSKGTYLKSIYLSSTMGPALQLDLTSLAN